MTEGQMGPRRSPLAVFLHRDFLLYWIGMCVSSIGTWMQVVGQSWMVLDVTGSPLLLGLQTAAQYAPSVLLSLIAGTLADRFSKRNILIIAQSVMMVSAFALAWLTWTGRVQYWHVLLLSFIGGIATAFDVPTRQALLIDLVGREDLMSAISLNAALFNVARVVGPAAAGVVLAIHGPAVAFFLNGASFLAIIGAL
ncbi:MAG: MFS transporter, partial [Bacillota bacterium]